MIPMRDLHDLRKEDDSLEVEWEELGMTNGMGELSTLGG